MRNENEEKTIKNEALEEARELMSKPWVVVSSSGIGFTDDFCKEYKDVIKDFASIKIMRDKIRIIFSDRRKDNFYKITYQDLKSVPRRLFVQGERLERLVTTITHLKLDSCSYFTPVEKVQGNKVYINVKLALVNRRGSKEKDSPKSEPKQNDLQNDYTAKMKTAEGWEKLALEASKMIEDPRAKVITQCLEEAEKCRQQMNTKQE